MDQISVKISPQKLSIEEAYDFVLSDECGGNCLFVGTVRDHNKGKDVTHLDFDTYDEMAVREMRKIAEYCIEQLGVHRVAIHHRSGHVGIRDMAVVIAIASPHRSAAFDACQYAIDTLKETVPIWKKEHLTDGSYWVGSRP